MTDLLLEWLSYRGAGRRDDLPEDLLEGEPPVWMLADLAALGHLDLLPDRCWRVAPPVLAAVADDSGLSPRAILCGARTPKILARLHDAALQDGADLQEISQPRRPSIVEVTAKSAADLPGIAAEAAIVFQRDTAFTLLACLPTIRNWPRTPCPMVAGRVQDVKRFSRSRLAWIASSLDDAVRASRGFFRIRRQWDWISLIKEGADTQAEIDVSAGRLAAAEHAKALQWDPVSRQLTLPFALYPPTLIARALVLCSGLLPFRDRHRHAVSFHNVPGRVARLTRALIGLRFA